MRRRDFIAALGGVASVWPHCLVAQPVVRTYRVGILGPVPASELDLLFDELSRLGVTEGRNLVIDRRGIGLTYEQLPNAAAELIRAGAEAVVCVGDAATRAAQAATSTTPIVAATDDMVGAGLVRSLAHPGGNTTGVSIFASELDGKRQEILFELLPSARRIAMLADSQTITPARLQSLRDTARSRSIELSIHVVERIEDIVPSVEAAKAAGNAALNVLASPLLYANRQTIIAQANALRMPAIYQFPEIAHEGGLVAYGPRFSEFNQQWARLLAKVLQGTKPADLPIEQPTRFVLALNLKTAGAIGFMPSPTMLNRADEVIE